MNKKNIFFVSIMSLILIFAHIRHKSIIVSLLHEQQMLERKKQELTAQYNDRLLAYEQLKNPEQLRQYALCNLGMKKLHLKEIKTIDPKECNALATT